MTIGATAPGGWFYNYSGQPNSACGVGSASTGWPGPLGFTGILADLVVYKTALSASQVQSLYYEMTQ